MVKPAPRHDWYLVPWCHTLGKIQADLVRDLGWNPSKASLLWHGKQRYHREDINEVADYLNIAPYELLMHPDDAMALRRLRDTALRIAADVPRDYIDQGADRKAANF